MGISAAIFRKDEYVTERDLDAIIGPMSRFSTN